MSELGISVLNRAARKADALAYLAGSFDLDVSDLSEVQYLELSFGGSQPMEWRASVLAVAEGVGMIGGFFRWGRVETGNAKPAFEWVRIEALTGPFK